MKCSGLVIQDFHWTGFSFRFGGKESACHEQLQAVRVEWVKLLNMNSQLLNDYSFMFASQMLNS